MINNKIKNAFIKKAKINSSNNILESLKKQINKPTNQFILLGIILFVFKLVTTYYPDVLPATLPDIIANVMVYSIMSIGFCLLLGYSGLASLGTAGFVGIGSYIVFYVMQGYGLSYFVTFLIALGVSIVLGLAVGFISLRIEGIYLAIITLGLSEVIRYALKAVYSGIVQIKTDQLVLFGKEVGSDGMFYLICVLLIVLLIITSNLINSPTGRAMIAMKNSTSAAQAYGISLMKYRLLAFVIATIYATLAGTAWLLTGNALSPSSEAEIMLKLTLSLNVLGAVIIGGFKSLWGTLFGVLFVFGLSSILTITLPYDVYQVVSPYISIFIGALMIIVVMFYPGGLAQLISTIKYKIKIKKAKFKVYKYGIED